MMLQCKTNQGLAIQQEVDRWVENYFHTQENYNFPRPTVGSDYVIYTLDAFKHHVATTAQHQEFPLPALTLLLPSASAPIQFMNLASTNNEEVTGLAACPRLCLECCSLDHCVCASALSYCHEKSESKATCKHPTASCPTSWWFSGFLPHSCTTWRCGHLSATGSTAQISAR